MVPLLQLPGAYLAAGGALLVLLLLLLALLWRERRRRQRAELSTAEGRSQLQTVTATMREGVIAYDMERRLTFVNPAFERLTGYPAEDLQEQEFLQYIHDDDRPAILAEWDQLAQGRALRDQEYRVVTRTGQIRWCSSSWEPMRDETGRQIGYLGTEFDITERKLAEEAMRLDTELFQAVLEVEQAVSTAGLDSQTVMRVIAERSQALTGASGAVIESIEGEDVVPLLHIGTEPPRLKVSTSLSGVSVRTGELQRCDDTMADTHLPHQAYREMGIRSIMVVPLKDEHRTLGVLKVVAEEAQAFTDRDAKALRLLGGLMGAALAHAAAFEARQSRLEERTRALQESEQRFKQLVDVAQEGIWVADDRGVITYVNQRLAELLGYANGNLLGRPVYDFIETDSRSGAQRTLTGRALRPGQSRDLRFRRRDGTKLWGLVSASPILGKDGVLVGTVGMVTDITERKRTEEQLRRSADRLTMLHDVDQAILSAQSPSEIGRAAMGRIRRLMPCQHCTVVLFDFDGGKAELIAGYSAGTQISPTTFPLAEVSAAEVLQQGSVRYIEDLSRIEDPPPLMRQLMDVGLRSFLSAPLIVENEVIGEINLASSTPAAFEPEHREIALEMATPLAIAIQHGRLRQELARQTGDLERKLGERNAALRAATAELETLLYSVSHDLRAPLRHLIGYSRMLLDDHGRELEPGALHYAERIHEAADQMATLIDDVVGLSRIGRQDLLRRRVELTTLVEDVVDQLKTTTDNRIIEWQVDELPTVECDPALTRLAITHLLNNAVKFTRTREPARIRVGPLESDGQLGLCVEDNGVGFRMAYAGKLFGMFQRLHRPDEFEGNGAGLAIVQRVAHKHGGRVWAESEPDSGATFYLTLDSQQGSGAAEPAPGKRARGQRDSEGTDQHGGGDGARPE
ncbi:MAG TPA: PAS domain S-box protein [Gemmatimonadales bacterium]|nr:PAS domain S-box protein [Gemmatimonadales bacterium]